MHCELHSEFISVSHQKMSAIFGALQMSNFAHWLSFTHSLDYISGVTREE